MKIPHLSLISSVRLAPFDLPARAVALPQPSQTKHERDGRWTAMQPLWTPYAHTIQHTSDTSQCTALSADRSLPPVRNLFRTAYTDRNIGGIPVHEMRTPEACNRQWSCTSVHSPGISECVRVWHGGPPASNNARWFECTSHGNLGRAEYTSAFPRPSDALLGPTSASRPTPRRWMHNFWVRS